MPLFSEMIWLLGYVLIKKIHVEMSKNDDALLMHFWNYIIWMHFWFSFIGFWCTFDVVSKVHQKCIMFLSISAKFWRKISKTLKNMIQKCIKSASKVHHCFPLKLKKILDNDQHRLIDFFAIQCGDRQDPQWLSPCHCQRLSNFTQEACNWLKFTAN